MKPVTTAHLRLSHWNGTDDIAEELHSGWDFIGDHDWVKRTFRKSGTHSWRHEKLAAVMINNKSKHIMRLGQVVILPYASVLMTLDEGDYTLLLHATEAQAFNIVIAEGLKYE